jgi:hypothetical protein
MKDEPIKADEYFKGLHECRLLVFLESDDHKTFYPVLLNAEQFKKVSDAIVASVSLDPDLKEGYDMATINMGSKAFRAELFDGLVSITPQEQLDAIEETNPKTVPRSSLAVPCKVESGQGSTDYT